MHIAEFQDLMRRAYGRKDRARGADRTFLWLSEEVGELASALRAGSRKEQEGEFADVFAWLCSLANIRGIDMEKALRKYAKGCPRCEMIPCACKEKRCRQGPRM